MKDKDKNLPQITKWFISRFSIYEMHFALSEDIEEDYAEIERTRGRVISFFWIWYQVVQVVYHYFELLLYWSFVMVKNYFKIALRNIQRYKGYAFINIVGLAIGIACFFTIMLYVRYELSYDRFHENVDRIFRIITAEHASTPAPLAPGLQLG